MSEGAVEGAAELVIVTHFTSAEGVAAIEGGALRAGSFVAVPGEVSGLTAMEVESALEIQAGRGAFSYTFRTPSSNLVTPLNGPFTSGLGTSVPVSEPRACRAGFVRSNANRALAMEPYKEAFPTGSQVRVANLPVLEQFLKTWKFHNPLKPEQLAFAGKTATVANVAFYHGGDPLYLLDGIPGIWHEECLV